MNTFLDFIFNIVSWFSDLLPDSFVASWIGQHLVGTAQASVILSYVNYFVPVNHLAFFMSIWAPLMAAIIVIFLIIDSQ